MSHDAKSYSEPSVEGGRIGLWPISRAQLVLLLLSIAFHSLELPAVKRVTSDGEVSQEPKNRSGKGSTITL